MGELAAVVPALIGFWTVVVLFECIPDFLDRAARAGYGAGPDE